MTEDRIRIDGLRLETRVGVPDEEREQPQTVEVSLVIVPEKGFAGLDDRIERTIDYYEVTRALQQVAAKGERKLIETLAEDLAEAALAFDGVGRVTVELRKFILPETNFVSVFIRRP